MIQSNMIFRDFVGKQFNSKRITAPTHKIGTSTRDGHTKLGCFKDTMTGAPASVKLPMPKF